MSIWFLEKAITKLAQRHDEERRTMTLRKLRRMNESV